jgi:Uma2 family endonuclease
MAVEVVAARRLFTREEYHRMGEVGILTRSDRVELIRGEIITMSPQGRRRRAVPYKDREAQAEDALLLVEVGESSLPYDRSTKLGLDAAAGIREYWIVDCTAESVEVFRTPQAGGYRDVTRVGGSTATVALQAFPDVVLTLPEIFA